MILRRGALAARRGFVRLHRGDAAPARFVATVIFLLLGVAACTTLPTDYPRSHTTALPVHQSTTLGQRLEAVAAQHPGESGFALVRHGRNAFSTRVAMTRLAEKTLDLQYYIWEPDSTGHILAEALLQAADRGVRVRLLVDDMNTGDRDARVAALDAHPNIEIRIFNPLAHRGGSLFDFVTDFSRVNHRMHNKILVMDNTLAIVGGRNIGDHYFEVNPATNFRDLDIAAAGPIVREISTVFDYFWNGQWSVPISVLVDRPYTAQDLQQFAVTIRSEIAKGGYPYSVDDDIATLTADMGKLRESLIWAQGRVLWDDPAEIEDAGSTSAIVTVLYEQLSNTQRSAMIESAYFVVGKRGLAALQKLRERGVEVRVLTNSLASNDVVPAHAGHAMYREQLLAAGVEVFEIRPDSQVIQTNWTGDSKAGLHTKAMVFDEAAVFIGSFNLDPRSASINTECGLLVDSPELAKQVLDYMDEGVQPANSYQVLLDAEGDLYWITETDGKQVRYTQEPETSFGKRFSSGFIQLLPVESQL